MKSFVPFTSEYERAGMRHKAYLAPLAVFRIDPNFHLKVADCAKSVTSLTKLVDGRAKKPGNALSCARKETRSKVQDLVSGIGTSKSGFDGVDGPERISARFSNRHVFPETQEKEGGDVG